MKHQATVQAFLILAALLETGPLATGTAWSATHPTASSSPETLAHSTARNDSLAEILAYRNLDLNEALYGLIHTLSPDVAQQVDQILNGVYVVDYQQAAPELLKAFTGQIAMSDMKFAFLYDTPKDPYYKKFVLGRQVLQSAQGPLTLDTLRQLHKLAIGYDANGSSEPGGMIRMRHVYGPEFDVGLTSESIATINSNPYLKFEPGLSIYADAVKNPESARIGNLTRGVTIYPRLIDIKDEALDRIRARNPDLIARIEVYRLRHSGSLRDRDPSLTQEMVTALISERIANFESNVAALGEIRTSVDVQRYIALITQFQRDYVSIHPFADGNGRTSRLILNHLAHRAKLPMVRFADPNEDDESSLAQWTELVTEGMHASAILEQDFLRRINLDQPLVTSAVLFTPVLPGIRYSPRKLEQFEMFLRTQFNMRPELQAEFLKAPVATMRGLRDLYNNGGK